MFAVLTVERYRMNRRCSPLLVVAFACVCASASAFDALPRKSGLWEMSTQTAEVRRVTRMCVDAASESKNNATTAEFLKASCSKVDQRMEGGKLISDMDCAIAGKQVKSHGVTTFSGDNTYVTEGTSTQGATRVEGKWLGPCMPGQTPGVPIRSR